MKRNVKSGGLWICLALALTMLVSACDEDDSKQKQNENSEKQPSATIEEVQALQKEVATLCDKAMAEDSPCKRNAMEMFENWSSKDECQNLVKTWNPPEEECALKVPMDWSDLDKHCLDEKYAYFNCISKNYCSFLEAARECGKLEEAVEVCLMPYISDIMNATCPKQSVMEQCTMNQYGGEHCDYACKGTWEECHPHMHVTHGHRDIMMKCVDGVLEYQKACDSHLCNEFYTGCADSEDSEE